MAQLTKTQGLELLKVTTAGAELEKLQPVARLAIKLAIKKDVELINAFHVRVADFGLANQFVRYANANMKGVSYNRKEAAFTVTAEKPTAVKGSWTAKTHYWNVWKPSEDKNKVTKLAIDKLLDKLAKRLTADGAEFADEVQAAMAAEYAGRIQQLASTFRAEHDKRSKGDNVTEATAGKRKTG